MSHDVTFVTDHSTITAQLAPAAVCAVLRSRKARLVSGFWCAVYSRFISPVRRLQRRATLSELADTTYWLSAVKSRSHTHPRCVSHLSSVTSEKSEVLHTLMVVSAAEVTRWLLSGENLQQRPYLL